MWKVKISSKNWSIEKNTYFYYEWGQSSHRIVSIEWNVSSRKHPQCYNIVHNMGPLVQIQIRQRNDKITIYFTNFFSMFVVVFFGEISHNFFYKKNNIGSIYPAGLTLNGAGSHSIVELLELEETLHTIYIYNSIIVCNVVAQFD